jgi:carbon-monoxide dehydrogenase medium subunit
VRVKPAPFEHAAPATLDEAVSLLERHADGEARVLAGGQSLMPLLNMRLARPELLVDLNRISELSYLRDENGTLAIGAMTRKRALEESALVARRHPLLLAATRLVAHPQIRNRGTVGGSMAHADPAAEYPALALLLGVELCAVGPQGPRRIAADAFFQGALTTALSPFEILTEVRVPALADGTGWSFQEVARRHGDFALGGAGATLRLDARGRIAEARVVLFGVGTKPMRLSTIEASLRGETPSEGLFEAAGRTTSATVEEPLADVHASAEYRRNLAGVVTRRALAEAAARCSTASAEGGRT